MATKTKREKSGRAAGTIKLRLIGSTIGCTDRQRASVRGIGLRRLRQVVERQDTPALRGMLMVVPHLVEIVE